MKVIHDYLGPKVALFLKFLIYCFIAYPALQFSFHMPTLLPTIGGSPSKDPIFFYVSTMLFTLLFGLSVRNRSELCRVWAAFVVVVCESVLAAKIANDLEIRDRKVMKSCHFITHRTRMRLWDCLEGLRNETYCDG